MTHIYALVSGQLVLYVGKTNSTLKYRESKHRCKGNQCHSRYIPDYIDWTAKLLETVPNDQAGIKEKHYYDTLKPLYNNKRPGQTRAEYFQNVWKKKGYYQSEDCKKARREHYLKKKTEAPVDETTVS